MEKPDARIVDPVYIKWLRGERCVICGELGDEAETVDPAHVGTYGKAAKTDDEALPVKHRYHSLGHSGGEVSMFRKHAPDWLLRDALRAYARERYREWLKYGEWRGGKFG